jgi:hypothetical protein
MAKDDKDTTNKTDIDKILERLEKSEVFERLIAKVRCIWDKHADPASKVVQTVEKRVEVPVEKIVEKIIYKDKIVEKRVDVPVDRIVEKKIEVVPSWAKSLESELAFLQQVQAHPEIAKILLPNGDNNVLQLIAIAAQWSNVLRIWDALATQVKDSKQAISVTEQQILAHSLALFNLTLQSSQATLKNPELGKDYDFEIHQKISGSGGTIEQVLLASLYNAADEKVRSAVVSTH